MGNSKLAVHLKKSPFNATYLTPDIQNKLIALIGEEVLLRTFSEVKDASCFAKITYKTTDKSVKKSVELSWKDI